MYCTLLVVLPSVLFAKNCYIHVATFVGFQYNRGVGIGIFVVPPLVCMNVASPNNKLGPRGHGYPTLLGILYTSQYSTLALGTSQQVVLRGQSTFSPSRCLTLCSNQLEIISTSENMSALACYTMSITYW